MIYTLFYSRMRDLDADLSADYAKRTKDLFDLATREHEGFVDIKSFVAEDGERLTVARFSDAEAQRAWKLEPDHKTAQAKGRSHFYESYRIVICDELRGHEWKLSREAAPRTE